MTDDREILRTLVALADLVIPPDPAGRLPAASAAGLSEYFNAGDVLDSLREGAGHLMAASLEAHGRAFAELDKADQIALADAAKRRQFRFISAVVHHVVQGYYRNDRVLAALGLEVRPPFPLGNSVEEGDFGLLEPVYDRGIRYRPMRMD